MKKVITYGTYDLFHQGHYNLLKRAKELGDYLIVAVTSEHFDKNRGKLNVHDTLMERIQNVQKTGFANEIIIEEYMGQKIDDIEKYDISIFTVGSDWKGHFDYLNEYCDVVYLERTKGISSTSIRNTKMIKLGIIGCENIVKRFIDESKFVSGIEFVGIYDFDTNRLHTVSNEVQIESFESFDELIEMSDALYVNLPPNMHYDYIIKSIKNKRHILCEFPIQLSQDNMYEILRCAQDNNVIVMEALKTAFCPGFLHLISIAKSGIIGNILNVDANFTQIHKEDLEDQIRLASGGSVNALSSYPLLVIIKLLGFDYKKVDFISKIENGIDIYTKINILYENACATAQVAINAKKEGDLIITGTKGYIYVPAPWWKTDYFEVRFEDINKNLKYFYKFEGDGLRYEISEFAKRVRKNIGTTNYACDEIMQSVKIIDMYLKGKNLIKI